MNYIPVKSVTGACHNGVACAGCFWEEEGDYNKRQLRTE